MEFNQVGVHFAPASGFCLAERSNLSEACVYWQPQIKEVLPIIKLNEVAYLLPVLTPVPLTVCVPYKKKKKEL